MLLGIFAFVGFEAALVAAGETRNPRRDVPFAVAMSLLIVLVLYAGVQIVCIAAVPALASSTAPFADAAVVLWGPIGEQVITVGAVVIMLGSLNSGFLGDFAPAVRIRGARRYAARARAGASEVQNTPHRDSGERRARVARYRGQLFSDRDHACDQHTRGRVHRWMHRADRAATTCRRAACRVRCAVRPGNRRAREHSVLRAARQRIEQGAGATRDRCASRRVILAGVRVLSKRK